ncbi:sterile alpha motif domain-containing protein 15 [Phodopus roborovskii]|uniref:Samd15 protein n=1 Tax=Phodopus roborovskii TaxID=109678 RepID=A0AAU9ZSN5_PHORO|nr:sterile alpha motif domain-containing protein 15 [Phodopus roborovskii]CAH6847396.1 Samd15 [Phodopus roborovskii]
MAEVPEDYDSDPDENEKLEPNTTDSLRSQELRNAKSDTVAEVTPEQQPKINQEPEELKAKEDVFEEGKPGSAENILLEPARTPKGIPRETHKNLPSQAEAEITHALTLETSAAAGGEDLEVTGDEKHEPDLQLPDISVDVLTETPPDTNTQLSTESKAPEATRIKTITELPEKKVPEQEGDTETGPEQNTPDFLSGKPQKSVEEENPAPSNMTELEITEKTQGESTKEPSKVTKPEFPGQMLRKSTEEAATKPPEGVRVKPTEQPQQAMPESPDKKPRQPIEKKVPAPLEELKLELSEEESRKQTEKASLELSEKVSKETQKSSVKEKIPEKLGEASLGLQKEIKPDVQGKTQEKPVEEKVPEPSEDRKPTGQKEKPRKSSEKSKSKGMLVEPGKEKGAVLQGQAEAEWPKKKLKKSNEETGQMPPHITKPEVQEKSQPDPTSELELSDEPTPSETATELPKEHRPEPSKFKYPVDNDEMVFPGYHKKMPEKETSKTKNEFMVGSPRESVESTATDDESQELLKENQVDICEEFTIFPSSESGMELRDSVSEKKVVLLPQGLEKMEHKESKIIKSVRPRFEHLQWSPEKVAEWIGELGFPQYKECFTENFISGQKLIYVNCCNLPQMGITDFEDMKTISHHTRELLGIEEPLFNRSISLPYRDNIGLFLEQKGHSGVKSASLTLSEFVKEAGLEEYGLEIDAMGVHESSLLDGSQEENKPLLQDICFEKE